MPERAVTGQDFPPPDQVRATLARLFNSEYFANAPRLRAFLQFIVDETLAGKARSLKAYTIAVGALGRRPEFDPVTDASVRVEAGRLRTALQRYYDNDGAHDALIVSMPLGGYVPEFRWRSATSRSSVRQDGPDRVTFERRETNLTAFRGNLMQLRSSIAQLHAEFAAAKIIMARSRDILEAIRERDVLKRMP